ncbi:MAG: amidohydrolase, partial [Bacteroidetes bacterium]|nr:amidohydrolase [Bacteroidota bacterium]
MKRIQLALFLVFATLVISSRAQAPVQQQIETKAKAISPKLIEWRRHIHQNPELGNREFKTQEYIANHLAKL